MRCPDCGGHGATGSHGMIPPDDPSDAVECSTCEGTGELPIPALEECRVFKIAGQGHRGSRSTGTGWYVETSTGHYLVEDQSRTYGRQSAGGPPYAVKAVRGHSRRPSKTKREVIDLYERFAQERIEWDLEA